MKNYVFFIGGSGARVYKAVIHSAAAGILRTREISTMLIDADESNDANTSSIELYRIYREIFASCGEEGRNAFTCQINMKSEKPISPVSSGAVNLQQAVGITGAKRNRILNCLYTPEEIRQDLKGGFYAHPNIGCIFFSDLHAHELNPCIEEIDRDLTHNQEVMVALVGSVFGGTGAAGIPTMFKLISDRLKENVNYDKLHIGGIFLEPYFKVNGEKKKENQNISISMDEFYFNTYEALSYYANRASKEMDFHSIYLVGQQETDVVNYEYADNGTRQKNKPHIVELYAALALDRFFNFPEERGIFGAVRKGKMDWSEFPGTSEGETAEILRLADFAKAQAIFLAEICRYVYEVEGSFREKYQVLIPQWYKAYEMKSGDVKSQMKRIGEYGFLFMDWLYMINSRYDEQGDISLNSDMALFGNVLEDIHKILQDMRSDGHTEEKEFKTRIKDFRDSFNTIVDTTNNIDYVLDKVFLVLSMAGIVTGKTAEAGVIGLFLKLVSLVGKQKKEN